MRRLDEGRRLHHRLSGRGPNQRPPEASVHRREAAAVASLDRGRPDGGRGAGGVFFMTGDFERDGKSIVF